MNIVTTGDSKFFHCLIGLSKSVMRFYSKQLIIYDFGLTDHQRESLDARIIQFKVDVDFQNYTTFRNVPFIQATHKPFCVKHYFDNYAEPMIFVDADCLFMERIEETGYDIGVTLKPRRNIDTSNHYSGVLNSGVIFFCTNCAELIDRWVDECRKPDTTDQKALTDILSESIDWKHYDRIYDWHGFKVKVLKVTEYNDYYLKTGRIFHFKGKRHSEDVYNQLVQAMDQDIDLYDFFRKLTGKRRNPLAKLLTAWLHRKSG